MVMNRLCKIFYTDSVDSIHPDTTDFLYLHYIYFKKMIFFKKTNKLNIKKSIFFKYKKIFFEKYKINFFPKKRSILFSKNSFLYEYTKYFFFLKIKKKIDFYIFFLPKI